jgi:DNA-entry nuclease
MIINKITQQLPLSAKRFKIAAACIIAVCMLTGCASDSEYSSATMAAMMAESEDIIDDEAYAYENSDIEVNSDQIISLSDIPEYSGEPYIAINGNIPYFSDSEMTTEAFENYSELDSLGRCGVAYANICKEIMPTEKRGSIGMVKPSGWHTVRYDDLVDGKYLYNRCHLIGYQLAGENANTKNLITGTRYLNVTGMLPFENMVDSYVEETENHVLYRVTPVFEGDNLVANGVLMEAKSVEDNGAGVSFCVYCYNVQPGIEIDYATGESHESGSTVGSTEVSAAVEMLYVANTNTGKFHRTDCSLAEKIKDENKAFYASSEEAVAAGYTGCKQCNP